MFGFGTTHLSFCKEFVLCRSRTLRVVKALGASADERYTRAGAKTGELAMPLVEIELALNEETLPANVKRLIADGQRSVVALE
jgi:hypothetical protein